MRRLLRYGLLLLFHGGFVRPVLALLGVRFRRRNLVPAGPCLVVANHNSHLDAPVLMSLFPLGRLPEVHPVAAADYFGRTWVRRAAAMLFMNAIPIERRAPAGVDPLEPVIEALRRGKTLIFFPEGSRGEAGVVAPFRPGVGRLVRRLPGLLVVPVFISGPERIWPRGKIVPVPHAIDVIVGKPRIYDPEQDPSVTAQKVRDDVLALAPPPPPVPGPRPAPPLRISVCGLQTPQRHAVYREIVGRLSELGPVLGVGAEECLVGEQGRVRELAGGVAVARGGWVARAFGKLLGVRGARLAPWVERARLDEATEGARQYRFVVSDGDALVELVAWSAAFAPEPVNEREIARAVQYVTGERRLPLRLAWRYLRRYPALAWWSLLDLARPPRPRWCVFVAAAPGHVAAALRARGSPLAPDESEASLERLDAAMRQVVETLRRRARCEVLEVAADDPAGLAAARLAELVRAHVADAGVTAPAP